MICKDIEGNEIVSIKLGDDGIVYGLDGSNVQLFTLAPECCMGFGYSFNDGFCYWSDVNNDKTVNVIINSENNDGAIFITPDDELCDLNVKFDYLFRFKCEQNKPLSDFVSDSPINCLTFDSLSQLKINYILQAIDNDNGVSVVDEIVLLDFFSPEFLTALNSGILVDTDTRGCSFNLNDAITSFISNGINVTQDNFSSTWVNFGKLYTDEVFLNEIRNKKLRIGFKVENLPCGLSLMVDNIYLNSICVTQSITETKILKNPTFLIEKVVDNKKSWLDTDNYREYDLTYRETKYGVDSDKLIINSKEIDLHFSSDNGIEHDLWVFIKNNPTILDGDIDGVNISNLIGEDITKINNLFEFISILNTRLIDVKSRKTLSGYPVLKLVYYRYVNSFLYCGIQSNAFTYNDMINFIDILDNHWIDLVEQFIPSTTIWGSTNKITNSIFDSEKFVYKKYSLTPTRYTGTRNENPNISIITPGNSIGLTILDLKTGYEETFEGYLAIKQIDDGSEFYGTVSNTQVLTNIELDSMIVLTETYNSPLLEVEPPIVKDNHKKN